MVRDVDTKTLKEATEAFLAVQPPGGLQALLSNIQDIAYGAPDATPRTIPEDRDWSRTTLTLDLEALSRFSFIL
jgi:hypothetical protein